MNQIADKPVKPGNCFLGICLPLSKQDYITSLDNDNNKSYAKIRRKLLQFNIDSLWEHDHLPLVHLINDIKLKLQRLGVTVKTDFSLSDIASIAHYEVAAILAHYDDVKDEIELFDNQYKSDIIIDRIPVDYNGIIDLTMCQSTRVQMQIKARIKNCLVVANKMNASPEFRLLCYYNTVSLLGKEDISYVDAITKIRVSLLKSINK